jgi:hypothetical protein
LSENYQEKGITAKTRYMCVQMPKERNEIPQSPEKMKRLKYNKPMQVIYGITKKPMNRD